MDNTSKIVRQYLPKLTRLDSSKLVFLNIPAIKTLPEVVDLRSKCGPILDQGNLGACTAFALAGIVSFIKPTLIRPSELFIYYNERVIENTVNQDAGATLTDGIASLKKYGVCEKSLWPYNINKFAVKPNSNCYIQAAKNKALTVINIKNTMNDMKNCLANRIPFVVGIPVYNSFESYAVAKTGLVPMPSPPSDKLLGYHAVVCVGFDDTRKYWIMRNSWGTSWGERGYFYLPYAYLTTDTSDKINGFDLWAVTKMNLSQRVNAHQQIMNKVNIISQLNNKKI